MQDRHYDGFPGRSPKGPFKLAKTRFQGISQAKRYGSQHSHVVVICPSTGFAGMLGIPRKCWPEMGEGGGGGATKDYAAALRPHRGPARAKTSIPRPAGLSLPHQLYVRG